MHSHAEHVERENINQNKQTKVSAPKSKHEMPSDSINQCGYNFPPLSFPTSSTPSSKAKQDVWLKFIQHMAGEYSVWTGAIRKEFITWIRKRFGMPFSLLLIGIALFWASKRKSLADRAKTQLTIINMTEKAQTNHYHHGLNVSNWKSKYAFARGSCATRKQRVSI